MADGAMREISPEERRVKESREELVSTWLLQEAPFAFLLSDARETEKDGDSKTHHLFFFFLFSFFFFFLRFSFFCFFGFFSFICV